MLFNAKYIKRCCKNKSCSKNKNTINVLRLKNKTKILKNIKKSVKNTQNNLARYLLYYISDHTKQNTYPQTALIAPAVCGGYFEKLINLIITAMCFK